MGGIMDISVIVPVYNVEKYLDDCLNSIINQNFKGSYEIICVNDGSTDNSLLILQQYQRKYPRIKIISQDNKGLSAARNTGLKYANGKYVFFIDSDDFLIDNDVFETIYNESELNQLDVLVADFEFIYEDRKKNYRIKRKNIIKNRVMTGKDFYDIGMKTSSIRSVVWNKLYKRELFIKNNLMFKEGILHEDMEFTPRMYQYANKVKYIDKIIIGYRQREGSIMSTSTSSNSVKSIDDLLIIAHCLDLFNEKYKSKAILNHELYIYLTIMRKSKNLKDKALKKYYKNKIKNRKLWKMFLKSNKLKYKVFGLLYFIKLDFLVI